MVIYKRKFEHPIIVDEGMLLKVSYSGESTTFEKADLTSFGGNGLQWNEYNKKCMVWSDQAGSNACRLDYNSLGNRLHNITDREDKQFLRLEFFIRQHHNWSGSLGILIVVKSTTGNIYGSDFLKITDFTLSGSLFSYYGAYWSESHIMKIPLPELDEELVVDYVIVTPSDVTDIAPSQFMKIVNYPKNIDTYVPIRQDKPVPDYITFNADIDEQGYLVITPMTLESSTLESSIKRYMGFDDNDYIGIRISYTIWSQGTNQSTGMMETNIVSVSNEENHFDMVRYALYLDNWIDVNDPSQLFKIDIMMDIEIDGKHIYRTKSINASFSTVILRNKIETPPSITYTEVIEETTVNQTVINQPTDVKIVKVNQPIFIRFVEKEITSFDTNVSHEQLSEPCYMSIGNQSISSQMTSDNVHYFDMQKFDRSKLGSADKYQIYQTRTNKLIGEGKISVS